MRNTSCFFRGSNAQYDTYVAPLVYNMFILTIHVYYLFICVIANFIIKCIVPKGFVYFVFIQMKLIKPFFCCFVLHVFNPSFVQYYSPSITSNIWPISDVRLSFTVTVQRFIFLITVIHNLIKTFNCLT